MRKNVAEKAAKTINAAPVTATTATKAKKAAGVSRAAKSTATAKVAPPRLSLATLAAMDTTSSKAVKVSKAAQTEKAIKVAKTPLAPKAIKTAKVPKAEKSPKVAKTAQTIKAPAVVEITDAATDNSAANGKRTLRGIKLAWNLDAAATDASKALSAPVAPPPAAEPIKVPSPQPASQSAPKIRPVVRPIAPRPAPQPSFMAGIRTFLRNPPGVTMIGLAALTIALGYFAVTQEVGSSNEVAPTAMVSADEAHSPDGTGVFPPAAFPANPGPDYGGHYNYREGRVRY